MASAKRYELAPEAEIAAAVKVARGDYDPEGAAA
jgi:hypothetical protein